MFKVGLMALAISLTFAPAKAFDNVGAARAEAAFAQFGLQGLAIAGRAPAYGEVSPFGPYEETPVRPPARTPVCWTRYATVANGNTLMNVPFTICR
jgi:hypothetical protein